MQEDSPASGQLSFETGWRGRHHSLDQFVEDELLAELPLRM